MIDYTIGITIKVQLEKVHENKSTIGKTQEQLKHQWKTTCKLKLKFILWIASLPWLSHKLLPLLYMLL